VPDRSGPGKFRGGTPYRRDYRLLADEAILQVRADRQVHRPYGLYGGEPGAPSVNVLNPESDPKPLPGKVTLTIRAGDVFRHELAGGGGWGDPLERDPERVLSDVRDELITEEFAREAYGVAIDRAAWTIDAAATGTLRAAHRATRSPGPLPKVGREPSRRPPQGRSS
jgi:N-methylhydantoinase B